jgi:hypothetical protein
MKKLMMLAVAGMFSVSAAAYACDGKDHQQATKTEKAAKVAKKDQKQETAPKDQKKS